MSESYYLIGERPLLRNLKVCNGSASAGHSRQRAAMTGLSKGASGPLTIDTCCSHCAAISLCVNIDLMELRNVPIQRHHHHGRHPMRRGSLRP